MSEVLSNALDARTIQPSMAKQYFSKVFDRLKDLSNAIGELKGIK